MKKHERHTNIILTAEFLLLVVCDSTHRLLARDAAAIKQQGMQVFSLHYSAYVKPFCHVFSLRSGKENQKKNRRLCYFSVQTKPAGSVSDRKLLQKPNAFPA